MVADKADEAAGLTPSNEDNDVNGNFSLEKPYCALSIDGISAWELSGSVNLPIQFFFHDIIVHHKTPSNWGGFLPEDPEPLFLIDGNAVLVVPVYCQPNPGKPLLMSYLP